MTFETETNHIPAKAQPKPGKSKAARKRAPSKSARKTKSKLAGSKTQKILDLLKRPGGASLPEIMKATDWQAHSVRGFLSGTLGKKMGLTIVSTKSVDGNRSYRIEA